MNSSLFFSLARYFNRGLVGFLLASSLSAWAQFRVEVSGVGLTQLPIAVANFRGDDSAPQKMTKSPGQKCRSGGKKERILW